MSERMSEGRLAEIAAAFPHDAVAHDCPPGPVVEMLDEISRLRAEREKDRGAMRFVEKRLRAHELDALAGILAERLEAGDE